jgi:hypothetical protein
VWLQKVDMPSSERLLGGIALALFPVIWSWRFTYRLLPVIPASAVGKTAAVWWLSGVFGLLCTVALVQLIPLDANGFIESRFLGVFVWTWLPVVIATFVDHWARTAPPSQRLKIYYVRETFKVCRDLANARAEVFDVAVSLD